MKNNYSRRKQPDLVRQALLDSAAEIAARDGFAALSIQAVAIAAGVTKGGLFHHFPSKQALVDAMLEELFERLDAAIDLHLNPDANAYGRFTRAYVEAVFAEKERATAAPCGALSAAMLADPELRRMRADWLDGRLKHHRATDDDARLAAARLAADGVWFGGLRDNEQADVRALLLQMTGQEANIHNMGRKGTRDERVLHLR